MKTGIELIAEERKEQIEKHGFDLSNDNQYKKSELKKAALYCLTLDEKHYPKGWGAWFRENIAQKTLMSPAEFNIEMDKIAAALLAADIDLINSIKKPIIGHASYDGTKETGEAINKMAELISNTPAYNNRKTLEDCEHKWITVCGKCGVDKDPMPKEPDVQVSDTTKLL